MNIVLLLKKLISFNEYSASRKFNYFIIRFLIKLNWELMKVFALKYDIRLNVIFYENTFINTTVIPLIYAFIVTIKLCPIQQSRLHSIWTNLCGLYHTHARPTFLANDLRWPPTRHFQFLDCLSLKLFSSLIPLSLLYALSFELRVIISWQNR